MATVTISSNLSQTARELGVSLSALLAANPQLSNPNIIRAGTQLNVPGRDNLSPAESSAQLARVFSNPLVSGLLPGAGGTTGRSGSSPPISEAARGGITPTFEGGELTTGGAARSLTSPYSGRTAVLAAGSGGVGLGQAFAREGAALTPQGDVATAAAALRTTVPAVTGLGQAFAREGAALTPQGDVATAAAALRTTVPAVTGLGRSGPTRGAVGTASIAPVTGQTFIQQAAAAAGPLIAGGGRTFIQQAAELVGRGATTQQTTSTAPASNNRIGVQSNIWPEGTRFTYAPGGARYAQLPSGEVIDLTSPATYGRQAGQALLNAASTGNLTMRPPALESSWAMEFKGVWDTLVPGATTLSEFMVGAGYQQIPGSTRWVRMDPTTISGGLTGGGGGGGGSSGGGGGGGGGGVGFSSGRAGGDSALYNWGIRITV